MIGVTDQRRREIVQDLILLAKGSGMDKLDIFEIDGETKIVTTISELQRLYFTGANDGKNHIEMNDFPVTVKGDIV